MDRRAFLSGLGVSGAVSLAGCSGLIDGLGGDSTDDPPAGSLRFENRHDLPHVVGFTVTDIGTDLASGPGEDEQRVTGDPATQQTGTDLTGSVSIDAGESRTYTGIFTEPFWYAVEFTIDGRAPETGRTAFHPAPPDRDRGRVIAGRVDRTGHLSWVESATDDMGEFETPGV